MEAEQVLSKVLVMNEIEWRYDGQWVLIADPEVDDDPEVILGRVIYHCSDHDEFDRKSLEFDGIRIAVRFIGGPAAEMESVL